MKKTPQRIMRELSQPFAMNDLEWRVQQSGKNNNGFWARIIAYVTNRAIQNRLDDAVGSFNWKNEFTSLPNSVGDGALCGLSLSIGGEWITKWDGAENTQVEAIKGGLSGAMKRSAVHWGIGRYLYDVEAMYAICITADDYKKLSFEDKEPYTQAKTKDKSVFYWKPKELHPKFLPQSYVTPKIAKEIEALAKETDTNMKDILDNFGVDDVRDLFQPEAGQVTKILLQRKNRLNEDKEHDKEN